MKDPIARVLYIPSGETKDLHGRSSGSDWNLAHVADGDGHCEVTTDSIHASEYGELFPVTGVGIARLMAYAINRLWQESTSAEWNDLLGSLDGPPPPPPPRQLDRCDKCGDLIEKSQCWTGGKTYHTGCTPNEFGEPY